LAGARERAGVELARGDRGHAARQPGNSARRVTLGRRPVAELAVAVVAPALDPAGAREPAGGGEAGANGGHAAPQPGDRDRRVRLDRGPGAELAVGVVAPALDPTGDR